MPLAEQVQTRSHHWRRRDGETVSVLQLWKQYLSEKCPQNPVPIFIALNEYNEHDVESPEKYILKKIGQEYLGKEHLNFSACTKCAFSES